MEKKSDRQTSRVTCRHTDGKEYVVEKESDLWRDIKRPFGVIGRVVERIGLEYAGCEENVVRLR